MRKTHVSFMLFLIAVSLVGCSRWQAAGDVMGQRAEDAVINQIGALDVQRQEVVNAITEAEAEIKRLVTVEADNAVEAAYLEEDLAILYEKKSESQREMGKLADHIESGEPLVLSDGTTVSVSELEQYASRRIQAYETLNQQIAAKEETLGIYRRGVQEAAERRTAGQLIITEMKNQLALIDHWDSRGSAWRKLAQCKLHGLTMEPSLPFCQFQGATAHRQNSGSWRVMDVSSGVSRFPAVMAFSSLYGRTN